MRYLSVIFTPGINKPIGIVTEAMGGLTVQVIDKNMD